MENPQKNKETACVFARFLEEEYSWKYEVVVPEEKNCPVFDAKLISTEHEELMLQMKQIIKGDFEFMKKMKGEPGMGEPGKDWKMFTNAPIIPLVKECEKKYGDSAKRLILVLHVDEGYLIPSDADLINKNYFKESTFKGIYLISPEHELWKAGSGKKIQDEFVSEIKNAFN